MMKITVELNGEVVIEAQGQTSLAKNKGELLKALGPHTDAIRMLREQHREIASAKDVAAHAASRKDERAKAEQKKKEAAAAEKARLKAAAEKSGSKKKKKK